MIVDYSKYHQVLTVVDAHHEPIGVLDSRGKYALGLMSQLMKIGELIKLVPFHLLNLVDQTTDGFG